jgi:hypothetical protein
LRNTQKNHPTRATSQLIGRALVPTRTWPEQCHPKRRPDAVNRSTSHAATPRAKCPKMSQNVPLEKMLSRRVPLNPPQPRDQKSPRTKTAPRQNKAIPFPLTGNWQLPTGNYSVFLPPSLPPPPHYPIAPPPSRFPPSLANPCCLL